MHKGDKNKLDKYWTMYTHGTQSDLSEGGQSLPSQLRGRESNKRGTTRRCLSSLWVLDERATGLYIVLDDLGLSNRCNGDVEDSYGPIPDCVIPARGQ